MPILVTGFEPFASSSLNPSQLIVEALAVKPGAAEHIFEVLPVEYQLAGDRLSALINQHKPQTVICIGQAEGRASISIETRAQNLDHSNLADNSGETRTGSHISPDGPSELSTTLHIFYVMQQLLEGTDVRSGFIHVPLVPEQASEFSGKPTLSLETQVEAFTIVLSYLERA